MKGIGMGNGQALLGGIEATKGAWLDGIVDGTKNRRAGYQRSVDYYEGRHRINLTARARKYLTASGLPYAHNFCERIVDSLVDKLTISGVEVVVNGLGADTAPAAPGETLQPVTAGTTTDPAQTAQSSDEQASKVLTEWLEQLLDTIGFDEIANVVHHDTVLKGDGYAHPYWDADNQRPEITYERAEGCAPFYCDGKPHQLEYVAKAWEESVPTGMGAAFLEQQRVNLYYDDRIEKYVKPAQGGEWLRWWDADDGEQDAVDENGSPTSTPRWPVPWVRAAAAGEQPTPRGLAFFHFRNKHRGKRYGTSEIRTALPQQDALNKRMVDLDLVSDNQGYAQRWATGVGTNSRLHSHPGSVFRTTNKDAKFGQFDAADPTGMLKVVDTSVQHLAGTTATPIHLLLIAGTPPSGESLKTAEGPFVTKVRNRHPVFGGRWSALLKQLVDIAIDHDQIDIPGIEAATITVNVHWTDPETRNEREHWEVVGLKQSAGVSKATTLIEEGYNPDDETERRSLETTAKTAAEISAMRAGNEFGGAPA